MDLTNLWIAFDVKCRLFELISSGTAIVAAGPEVAAENRHGPRESPVVWCVLTGARLWL